MPDNPNAASVALIDRGRVLLIQRARKPYDGMWTLPGGRLEPGEDAEAAAIREIREELDLRIYALRPIMHLQLGPRREFRLAVFATEAFEGTVTPSDEVSAYRWVHGESVEGLNVTPHLPEVLERALRLFDRT